MSHQVLIFLSTFIALLPTGLGLANLKKLDRVLFLLLIYVVLGFVVDCVSIVLKDKGIVVGWLYHLFTLAELLLVVSILKALNAPWFTNKIFLLLVSVFYSITWLLIKFFIESWTSFDFLSAALASFIILVLTTLVFLNLYQTNGLSSRDSKFWLILGLLSYFSVGSAVLALFGMNLSFSFPVHSIANIIKHLCFAGAFLCLSFPRKFSGLSSSLLGQSLF